MKTIFHFLRLASLKKREGSALIMALIVVLVGSALIAVIFEMSTRFGYTNLYQRQVYSDQVIANTYIEDIKGRLAMRLSQDAEALHPLSNDEWNRRPHINSLRELQVFLDRRNPDTDLLSLDKMEAGQRRVQVRVYDLTYEITQVPNTVLPEVRAQLPTPLTLMDVRTATNQTNVNEGTVDTIDIKDPPNNLARSRPDLRDIGAYLVRVEVFDAQGHRVRLTEEAFFQLTSDNIGIIN